MIDARLPDWEPRLAAYLAGATADARAARVNYCALFAAGAVKAQTGKDPTAAYRRKYHQVAERLEQTIDEILPQRHVAFARRGDLVWNDGAVGVVIGADALFVGTNQAGDPDLVRLPRRDWEKAWSVGHV